MVCPVCVAGAFAGLAIAREFGINDLVSGIWIGAFSVASLFWLNNWAIRRYGKWHKYQTPTFLLLMLLAMSAYFLTTSGAGSGTCGV